MSEPKFSSKMLVSTPAAIAAFERSGDSMRIFLAKHFALDKGTLCEEDHQLNLQSIVKGKETRVFSAFTLSDSTKIWIITEWDRSVTTVLLPEEY